MRKTIIILIAFTFWAGNLFASNVNDWGPNTLPPPSICCDVERIPDTIPVIVTPGSTFGYTGILCNPSFDSILTDAWIEVEFLGVRYDMGAYTNFHLTSGECRTGHFQQFVCLVAQPGVALYWAFCGDYETKEVCDSSYFEVIITEGRLDGGASEWSLNVDWQENQPSKELMTAVNYPNPFNAQSNIIFDLPIAGNVNLEIYNLLGQKVAVLADGIMTAGQHKVIWNAADYSSGAYFYRLRTGEEVIAGKMNLLK